MPQYRQADEEKLTGMVLDALRSQAKGIAALLGPAPDSEAVAGEKEIAMYNYRAPNVDVVAEYQKALAAGKDDDEAKSIATGLAYPYRLPMLLNVAPEPDLEGKRIAYAKRMKRLNEGQAEEEEPSMEGGYANAIDIG